jgi:3-phosphoshikimate 1-carboxyvinyltransferase
MQRSVRASRSLRGAITPPSHKSISHRAAIFNGIARGEALIENFLRGADCLSTLRCLRQLGVPWQWRDESTLWVKGVGRNGLREATGILNCGNSGTTMRLLAGLLAAQPFFSVLTGDASLRSRPMARIVEPLRQMGAAISGRDEDRCAPLAIREADLHGIRYPLPVASAQVKSAILLAGLYAHGETTVEEPTPTRDHTERMLRAMGAEIQFGEGAAVRVQPLANELSAISMRVPGDISSAAPWLVLAAAHPDAEIRISAVGVNPTRTGIVDALRMMGAEVRVEEERTWGPEPVADIVVKSSRLHGAVIEGNLIPRAIDELPLIALAGCFAEGETVIRNAEELLVKESNRVRTTAEGLRRLGAEVEETRDGLRVWGPQKLKGATASSRGDHRTAMLLAIAGALAQGETIIRDSDAVAVSYPTFWQDLDGLSA